MRYATRERNEAYTQILAHVFLTPGYSRVNRSVKALGLTHFEVVVSLLGGLLPPNKPTDPLQLHSF